MKFTKSERHLHQPNYNPPCNVYQSDNQLANVKISSGTVPISSPFVKNTFGYAKRFDKKQTVSPGPASYFQQKFPVSLQPTNDCIKNKLYKSNWTSSSSPPSIPYNYYGQDADEEEKNYVKQLLLSEDVIQSCKLIKRRDPAFSFSKSERNLFSNSKKKKLGNDQINDIIEQQDKNMFGQSGANYEQKKTSIVWQQKIKRANQRRLQVIQTLDPQFIPSLQLIELIRKKKNKPTPGPGDYYQVQQCLPKFQISENIKGISFTSVKRFNADKVSILGPGLYNPKPIQGSRKVSFSKSSRSSLEKKDDTNFRFYINPEPVSQKQNSKLGKQKAGIRPFGSGVSRFPQVVDDSGPTLTLEQERKRQQTNKLNNMIKIRQKLNKKQHCEDQKDSDLLGISTMASTID